jgi:hypothetical protein
MIKNSNFSKHLVDQSDVAVRLWTCACEVVGSYVGRLSVLIKGFMFFLNLYTRMP